MTVEEIAKAALALPSKQRSDLVEVLLRRLRSDRVEITYAKAWQQEIDDRLAAYDRGEMRAYSREEVMRSIECDP